MNAPARDMSPVAGRREPAGGGAPLSAAFTIPTPPSANHLFRNLPNKGRVKSRHYEDFTRRAVTAIRQQGVQPLAGRVIAIFGVERMSAQADIDNRLKAMLDSIVAAGVIEDDSLVTAIAIAWLPKANGMSHVRLLPVQRLGVTFHPSHDGACGGWFENAPPQQEDCDHGHIPG